MGDFPARSHWTRAQIRRFDAAVERGDTIAYWCSDAHGRPCNGGAAITRACAGLAEDLGPGETRECSREALHATREPHRWRGSRVWIVALSGDVREASDKIAARRREIVGEVLPEECLDVSVGARLGRRDLRGADLRGANLRGADLRGANLDGADLDGAYLDGANLVGAYLRGANLVGANLVGANLDGADLDGAYLDGANLVGAYLDGANLVGWERGADGFARLVTS